MSSWPVGEKTASARRIAARTRWSWPACKESGFAVIGDSQYVPGYSLLLCEDPAIDHLTDLAWPARVAFLFGLSLLGEAIQVACADGSLVRVNYEVLGNADPWLHGHVVPRYARQPPTHRADPAWNHPPAERNAPEHLYDDSRHGVLRARITDELNRLMLRAYGT